MDIKEIKRELAGLWERTSELISLALETDIDYLAALNARLLENSGKQLRPVLALLVASACGQPNDDSCHYAAASELLHNATLLHDDVADKSDCRRGKPTLNALMGPSVSVLVGDYWLVRAVRCILDAKSHGENVIRVFAKTLSDLTEGEMLQLQKAETCDTSEEDYLKVIYCKTASLFEAASLSAAISVNATEEMQSSVRRFATDLGIAFQIRDDIFDYSLGMNVGKPVGADILERKITLPLLGAFAAVDSEKEEAIRARLRSTELDDAGRGEICEFVRVNGGLEYAKKRMGDFLESARRSLLELPCSPARDTLGELLDFVGARKN